MATGQLTTTLHADEGEGEQLVELADALAERSGRVVWSGWPTGVAVTNAPLTTSVGTAATERFLRPVTYQSWPQHLLPPPLRDENPWQVPQRIG